MNIKNMEILEFGEELVLREQCVMTGESFHVKVRKADSGVSPKGWRKFLEKSD